MQQAEETDDDDACLCWRRSRFIILVLEFTIMGSDFDCRYRKIYTN